SVKDHLNQVALAENRKGLYRLFSARQEYGSNWYKFLHPSADQDQVLTIDTAPERFAFFTNGLDIKVTGIDVVAKLSDPGDYSLVIDRPGAAEAVVTMSVDASLGGLHTFSLHPFAGASDLGRAGSGAPAPTWAFKLQRAGAADFRSLVESEVDDLVLILQY